ncbi:MAG: PAS domain S-box protein [Stellaceae bacterium]
MILGIAAFLTLLAATGFLGIRYWYERQAASHSVEHSRQVIETLERVRASITDLETERRDYLLTLDPTHLNPYGVSEESVRPEIEALQTLVADDPLQSLRAAHLALIVEAKLRQMDEILETARTSGLEAALAKFPSTNEIQSQIDQMLDIERFQLAHWQARVDALHQSTIWLIAVAVVIAIIFAGAALALALLELTRRRKATDENTRLYSDLQEREAKIRRLVDSNIIGIAIWQLEGQVRVVDANDAFLDIVGYDREDLVSGRIQWTEMTPPEWHTASQRALAQMRAMGSYKYEKEYFRKDGSRVPVLVGGAAIEGKRDESVAFVLDLTERKRAEESLRESEQRFRDYAETASDWFWETGRDHSFTYVSERATAFGHKITIGRRRWDIAADLDEEPEKWRRHLDTLAQQQPFRGFTYKVVLDDGSPRYIGVSGKPVFDPVGCFLGYRGGSSDVTAAVLADEAVREAREEKAAAEAERLRLLRRLINAQEQERLRIARELHDQMGQDLTGLSLSLKSLEHLLGGEGRSMLRALQSLTAQMGSNMHRIATELRPTALDDVGLLRALETTTADWGERYGIRVDFDGGDLIAGMLPMEMGTTIYRIVQEALTNVLKHAAASAVSIVLECRDGQLQIIVEDNGKGFDPNSPIIAGHLGLAGIRERLALIGGVLIIDSAPDVGTTLYVRIPFVQADQNADYAAGRG